jgi:hypothetical protein
MIRMVRYAVAVGLGAALVAGCAPAAGTAPPPVATTQPSVPRSNESVGEAVLEDGRHPVYLKSLDLDGRTITFDLLEFYVGDAAAKAWAQDHPGVTEEPALNGYYIRNNNTRLRSLAVADGVIVKIVDPLDGSTRQVDLGELVGPFAGRPFWLEVLEGKVTAIEEQFIP